MTTEFIDTGTRRSESLQPVSNGFRHGQDGDAMNALALVIGQGEAQQVGRFSFFSGEERWEWSDAVARLHGYEPGTTVPTTDLLRRHLHPDDRHEAAAVLSRILQGQPFSSRYRINDTDGLIHWVVVVGDVLMNQAGIPIGVKGFFVDVTRSLQANIATAISDVCASRADIEQAKGVLMAAYGISADRAFKILAWRSQETNIKIRDLAPRFLAAISRNMSTDTVARVDHALLTLE